MGDVELLGDVSTNDRAGSRVKLDGVVCVARLPVPTGLAPGARSREDAMTRIPGGPNPLARVDMGDGHYYTPAIYQDEWVGIHEWHLDAGGQWCAGWIPFAGALGGTGGDEWTVESRDPLTLSPSLLCRACGNHGFIRAGRWVEA